MGKPTREEITKAYHETGHAVIARVLDIRVNLLTTLGVDGVTAAVAETHSAAYQARDADQEAKIAGLMKDMIVCFAGPHAQAKHRPPKRKRPSEWSSDLDGARSMAATAALIASGVDVSTLTSSEADLNADQVAYAEDMARQASEAARGLVAEHWATIDRIANVLLDRPILNGGDLDKLILTSE